MSNALARVSQTVLALLALGLGGLDLATAQTPPDSPPNTVDAYVLLGLSKIDVSNSIQFTTGSIGVNQSGGTLQGNNTVELNQQDGVVAASTVTLNQPSTCAALFANAGNGSGQCSPVRPIPSPQPPLVPDLENTDICRLPSPFPTCSSEAVIVDAGTVRTLDPGTYGNLTVNGGTLMLEGNGEYVFCNVDVNNGSIVVVVAPSTLLVTDRFNVQPDALINAEGTPTDLRVLVNGLGVNITGSSSSPRTTVVAQICAPTMTSQMNLMSATLGGTFVADAINVGNVSGGLGPVVPTTTTTASTSTCR